MHPKFVKEMPENSAYPLNDVHVDVLKGKQSLILLKNVPGIASGLQVEIGGKIWWYYHW